MVNNQIKGNCSTKWAVKQGKGGEVDAAKTEHVNGLLSETYLGYFDFQSLMTWDVLNFA